MLRHFAPSEKLFQMHGDTFDMPKDAVHLARSKICDSQAFRYGKNAYGLQFHLEVDQAMIDRFLTNPENRAEVEEFGGKQAIAQMASETEHHLARSLELSRETFLAYTRFFGGAPRDPRARPSGHRRA